ncbi:KR domain-containing protein [Daldinia loculata]|nr:KR domain-containing protein [Daldinia loculata]
MGTIRFNRMLLETVLIQSATGGLGLAAIQLAQAKGAEVFAMVGTTEKAYFLIREMKLPESHVIAIASGDGTSALDKKLARMTPHGRGFDIILSTARGDVLHASIQALAPLGHLIDVGRTDVQESKALGMELFGKSANFSSFDLSLVLDADPALGKELMQAVHNYYQDGLIKPVRPFSATDVSKLDQVLLRFSKGTHVGKLVVTFQDPQTPVKMLPIPSQKHVQFDPAAYYIVVGGFGGLGRSIIRWMCQRGARNLVVLSRRGIEKSSPVAQNLVNTLESISLVSPNTPVKGIIHAAVSYLDLSFDKLTVQRWRDSLAAKVQGSKNLHEATLSLPRGQLDFFVMVTSLESIYALATQSAYTAANAFQDSFARYRRRLGMPAKAPERFKTVGFVTGAISTAVADMLFVEVSNINPGRSVADHGVDSLIAAELRNWFHQALGAKINMQELLDARSSIAALAGRIVDAASAKRQDVQEGK